MRHLRLGLIMLLLAAACVTVSACGGGSSSTEGGGTSAEAGSEGGSEGGSGGESSGSTGAVEERAEAFLSTKSNFKEAPTKPVKPPSGKKLMLVSCGQTITACKYANDSAEEAAKDLGWQTTLFDTKGELAEAATAVRNAVAQGYDGITMYFIDCSYAKAALQEAKEAKIPVVTAEGFDCGEINPSAPELFTYKVEYSEGKYVEHAKNWGRSIGDYAVLNKGGDVNALIFADESNRANVPITEGIEEALDECSGCSSEVVTFPISDFGTSLQRIAEQELLKHPEVNTVLTTYEAISLEVRPAVQAAGREILLFLGEGGTPGMDLIREGTSNVYASGFPIEWEGYAMIDAFARIFAGQEPEATGIGVQLIDEEHNLSPKGPYAPPVDYKKMYRKLWGVG